MFFWRWEWGKTNEGGGGGEGEGRSIFKMKDSRFCQSIFCYVSSFYFLMEHINKTTQKLEII